MKAYVINLDRSPERLALFSERANVTGLVFERVSAIDGQQAGPALLQDATATKFQFRPITAPETALFLSHKAVWQKLVDSTEDMAAVFEDDAVPCRDIVTVLDAVSALGPAFGILRLETTGRRIVVEKQSVAISGPFKMQRLLSWHGGTAGYVITRTTALALLERFKQVADPVDQALFNPLSVAFKMADIRQIVPGAVIQHEFLHGTVGQPELQSTIPRLKRKGRLFRHSLFIDLRLAWLKHLERRARNRLGRDAANQKMTVPFADWSRPA